MEKYQDAALSPRERAEDLLEKMTLKEKVGQLNQRLYGFRIYERDGENVTFTEEFREEVEKMGGLGVLYGFYRADPWADKDENTGITTGLSRKAYNALQKYVLDHSRLGIPVMMSSECPHGHQALGGGLLPVNLAAGATFDPEALKEGYEACGRQLKSGHVELALMSALDMLRDPRWGRSEECYSEDPYLSSRMAAAAVTGMQSEGVSCVAKHFCGQGETTGGVNASAARIGEQELREIHFPAMQACCDAGVDGVMAAYNEIDGVYCHSNPWLLRDVLREEMGFQGIVMADGLAVDFLKNTEGDTLHAGATALKAGVDVGLWDESFSRLGEAVEKGLVDEKLLDEAVLRVLELKFKRGLFEHPYCVNLAVTLPTAYALSRDNFSGKKPITIFYMITMFFGGGMIPTYLVVKNMQLLNTIWALVLPGCLSVYNMIVARTFFKSNISEELYEAGEIDGCTQSRFFFQIALPLSKAIIAIMVLYYGVGHWNSYFSALLYISDQDKYPLQLVLRNILITNQTALSQTATTAAARAALQEQQQLIDVMKYSLIIISSVPVLIMYPLVQKHFVKGVMIGSVKG